VTSETPEGRLEAVLSAVIEALPAAAGRERAHLLKRAGDACVSMGEPRRALSWYGRAVDQWLELGDASQAALLCRLIIFVQPEAVRARCTLTWIALGAERHSEVAPLLKDYVEAARHGGQTEVAAQQLGWMFEAAHTEPTRARIVVGMLRLGETERAEALAAELAGMAPGSGAADREELWTRVLRAAVGTPAA
jgi:hypothetical protein